jgi:hypothetical protein
MLRLLGVTLLLVLISAATILVARVIGGTHPNPLLSLFTHADGSSCGGRCLFGITPGETKWTDALSVLALHPRTLHLIRVLPLFVEKGPSHTNVLLTQTNDGRVSSIGVNSGSIPRNGEVSLSIALPESAFGDITNVLGPPIFVIISGPSWAVYPIGNDLVLYAQIKHDASKPFSFSLNPHDRLVGLRLANKPNCSPDGATFWFQRWKGFSGDGYRWTAKMLLPVDDPNHFTLCQQ